MGPVNYVMRFFIVVFFLALACSCSNSQKEEKEPTYLKSSLLDSSSSPNSVDSLKSKMTPTHQDDDVVSAVYWDTVGVSSAPVKVLKAWLYRREYSSYKDIAVQYKNVSGKKISAIRFRWYGLTAFNDPADMGTSMKEGFGGGFTDTPLRPGGSTTSEWSILSRNGKKVVMAWPTEVAFEDGTKWKSSYR